MNPIRKVAVLLMIEGVAEIATALVYGAFALSARHDGAVSRGLIPADMIGVLSALAIALLITGGLKIAAGVRNHAYRDRTLGLVALASGVVPVLTCVCAPTALALMVYGLRVYARPWPSAIRAVDSPRGRT